MQTLTKVAGSQTAGPGRGQRVSLKNREGSFHRGLPGSAAHSGARQPPTTALPARTLCSREADTGCAAARKRRRGAWDCAPGKRGRRGKRHTHRRGAPKSWPRAQASADILLQPWACRAERGRPRGQRPAGTQLHGAKLNWPPQMSTASLRPGSPPPASRRTGSDAATGPHPDSCVSARAPAIPSSAQSGPCARGVGARWRPGSEWGSDPCSPLWALTPSRTMCLPQNIPSAPTNTLLCFKNRTI